MDPANAPLPTCWNLPFQPETGIHTSVLMSESDEGVIVSSSRQNAGRLAIGRGVSVPATGGVNDPAGTRYAAVILASASFNVAATRSHAASFTVSAARTLWVRVSCADAIEGTSAGVMNRN